jgi:hypothetical protein
VSAAARIERRALLDPFEAAAHRIGDRGRGQSLAKTRAAQLVR